MRRRKTNRFWVLLRGVKWFPLLCLVGCSTGPDGIDVELPPGFYDGYRNSIFEEQERLAHVGPILGTGYSIIPTDAHLKLYRVPRALWDLVKSDMELMEISCSRVDYTLEGSDGVSINGKKVDSTKHGVFGAETETRLTDWKRFVRLHVTYCWPEQSGKAINLILADMHSYGPNSWTLYDLLYDNAGRRVIVISWYELLGEGASAFEESIVRTRLLTNQFLAIDGEWDIQRVDSIFLPLHFREWILAGLKETRPQWKGGDE